jgi:hypothetical protein
MEHNIIKYEKILSLPSQERYVHSIKQIVGFSELWGLFDNGWALVKDENIECFPIWPENYYAKICCVEDWTSYHPEKIDLEIFLEEFIPNLLEDGKKIANFMTPQGKGIVVTIDEFLGHVEWEMDKY